MCLYRRQQTQLFSEVKDVTKKNLVLIGLVL